MQRIFSARNQAGRRAGRTFKENWITRLVVKHTLGTEESHLPGPVPYKIIMGSRRSGGRKIDLANDAKLIGCSFGVFDGQWLLLLRVKMREEQGPTGEPSIRVIL